MENRWLKKALAALVAAVWVVAQVGAAPEEQSYPIPPADLNIHVLGTASFQGRDTALIQDVNTGSDSFYRVGDCIYGYKILTISRHGVAVEKSGNRFFSPFKALQPAPEAPRIAKPVTPNNYLTGPDKTIASNYLDSGKDVSPNFYLDGGTKSTDWDIWSDNSKSRKTASLGGRFILPIANYKRLSSTFGYRKHPLGGGTKMHSGVDLSARKGTKIFAADNGRVVFSGYRGGYGYCLEVDHHNGYSTLYGHCSKLLADVGDNVRRGEFVAEVGSTGASTGPHLHFEVRQKGKAINPRQFFVGTL